MNPDPTLLHAVTAAAAWNELQAATDVGVKRGKQMCKEKKGIKKRKKKRREKGKNRKRRGRGRGGPGRRWERRRKKKATSRS